MKIKGIRNAKSEYKNAQNVGLFPYYYLDRSTGDIWTKVYADCNSESVYDDPAVINLSAEVKHDYAGIYDGLSLTEIAQRMCDEYKEEK